MRLWLACDRALCELLSIDPLRGFGRQSFGGGRYALGNQIRICWLSRAWLMRTIAYASQHIGESEHLTLQSAKVIIVPHRITWSWYTGRWWVGCYIWYSDDGAWADCGPAQSPHRFTKCNRPPINGQCTDDCMLYIGPLLCRFNVPIKGLQVLDC